MHQRSAAPAIDQAGGVAHQVLDRDLAVGRHGLGDRFAMRRAAATLMLANFGKYFAERIVDQDLALLVEHQGADRRHRLGHRGDVEDGVGGHRRHRPPCRASHRRRAPPACRGGRWRSPRRECGPHRYRPSACADPRQPLAGEADVFGLGAGQGIVGKGGGGSEQAKCARECLTGTMDVSRSGRLRALVVDGASLGALSAQWASRVLAWPVCASTALRPAARIDAGPASACRWR